MTANDNTFELYKQTSEKLKDVRKDYLELLDAAAKLAFSPFWLRRKAAKELGEVIHRHAHPTK